jgi:tetratricopeptide (TPR) repeat protein
MSIEAFRAKRATLLHLLEAAVRKLPADAARGRVEAFFERAYGRYPSAEGIPDAGLDLLLRTRSTTAIMSFLHHELALLREDDRRVLQFLERLARAAAESGDPGLGACHAYAKDLRERGGPDEGFEQAVARLPLSRATADVLGRSRLRYREAVDLLMQQGSVDGAELYCRVNRDPGLAAAWAEKRGDNKGAVRYYREARDLEGALRCARASGDQRQVARVLEWRGEFADALRIWKKLGRRKDVERLLRKRPMLKGI